eukprot:1492032-Rhodomonas_salina.4
MGRLRTRGTKQDKTRVHSQRSMLFAVFSLYFRGNPTTAYFMKSITQSISSATYSRAGMHWGGSAELTIVCMVKSEQARAEGCVYQDRRLHLRKPVQNLAR